MDELKKELLLKEVVDSKENIFKGCIGLNAHGIAVTNVNLQSVVCF